MVLEGRLAACGSAAAASTTHPKPEGLKRCTDALNCAELKFKLQVLRAVL